MDYHKEVMNLTMNDDWSIAEKQAHKCARHQAAEIAIMADSEIESLRASLKEKDEILQELQSKLANEQHYIEQLYTVMMAAAVEITDHWDAHCDEEGCGPSNLVRRLEMGTTGGGYGYSAKTVVEMSRTIDDLKLKLAEAEKDAKLYQALKTMFARNNGLTWHFQGNGGLDPSIKDLDEAINAAIANESKPRSE